MIAISFLLMAGSFDAGLAQEIATTTVKSQTDTLIVPGQARWQAEQQVIFEKVDSQELAARYKQIIDRHKQNAEQIASQIEEKMAELPQTADTAGNGQSPEEPTIEELVDRLLSDLPDTIVDKELLKAVLNKDTAALLERIPKITETVPKDPIKVDLSFMEMMDQNNDEEPDTAADEKKKFFERIFKRKERKKKQEVVSKVLASNKAFVDSLLNAVSQLKAQIYELDTQRLAERQAKDTLITKVQKMEQLLDRLKDEKTDTAYLYPDQSLEEEIADKLELLDGIEEQYTEEKEKLLESRKRGAILKTEFETSQDNKKIKVVTKLKLTKEVFGWHKASMGDAYKSYDFNLISTVAFFGLEINPRNGYPYATKAWKATELIEFAHNLDRKAVVTICGRSNGEVRSLLSNGKAMMNLIDTVYNLVVEKNADGVNVNFEGLNRQYRENFTNFMILLSEKFKSVSNDYQISMTLPPIDYDQTYDLEKLNAFVDYYIIMGYEFSGSFSEYAGPTAPLNGGKVWGANDLTTSIEKYLLKKADQTKLLLGLPYYGHQWKVKNAGFPTKAVEYIGAKTYSQIRSMYKNLKPSFEPISYSPFYVSGAKDGMTQLWFDNEQSLARKIDLVFDQDIGGIGIFTLDMASGFTEMDRLIEQKFLVTDTVHEAISNIEDGALKRFLNTLQKHFIYFFDVLAAPQKFYERHLESKFDELLLWMIWITAIIAVLSGIIYLLGNSKEGKNWSARKFVKILLIISSLLFLICFAFYAYITFLFQNVPPKYWLLLVGLLIGLSLGILIIRTIVPIFSKPKELP